MIVLVRRDRVPAAERNTYRLASSPLFQSVAFSPASLTSELWDDAEQHAVLGWLLSKSSENTRKAYASDLRRFLEWCGLVSSSFSLVATRHRRTSSQAYARLCPMAFLPLGEMLAVVGEGWVL